MHEHKKDTQVCYKDTCKFSLSVYYLPSPTKNPSGIHIGTSSLTPRSGILFRNIPTTRIHLIQVNDFSAIRLKLMPVLASIANGEKC